MRPCPPTGLRRAALLALALAGCEEPSPEEGALVLATLETHRFCDDAAVVEVRLRAHWLACPQDEPACEPPRPAEVEGDRYGCPATDATHTLGVRLLAAGRYRVEAVAHPTVGQAWVECFMDPATGDAQIEVPADRLDGQDPVVLDEHGPCP